MSQLFSGKDIASFSGQHVYHFLSIRYENADRKNRPFGLSLWFEKTINYVV